MPRRHFLVKGHVQGIGYRWFVQRTASRLGMTGWVRNLPNGDVETQAQGDEDSLERFLRPPGRCPPIGFANRAWQGTMIGWSDEQVATFCFRGY